MQSIEVHWDIKSASSPHLICLQEVRIKWNKCVGKLGELWNTRSLLVMVAGSDDGGGGVGTQDCHVEETMRFVMIPIVLLVVWWWWWKLVVLMLLWVVALVAAGPGVRWKMGRLASRGSEETLRPISPQSPAPTGLLPPLSSPPSSITVLLLILLLQMLEPSATSPHFSAANLCNWVSYPVFLTTVFQRVGWVHREQHYNGHALKLYEKEYYHSTYFSY